MYGIKNQMPLVGRYRLVRLRSELKKLLFEKSKGHVSQCPIAGDTDVNGNWSEFMTSKYRSMTLSKSFVQRSRSTSGDRAMSCENLEFLRSGMIAMNSIIYLKSESPSCCLSS